MTAAHPQGERGRGWSPASLASSRGGAWDGLQLEHRAGGGLFTLPSSTDHHSFNRKNPQRSSLQQKWSFYDVIGLRVGHGRAASLSLFTFLHRRRQRRPSPVFLPGESQGRGSLAGCRPWGRTESDTAERLSSCSSSRAEESWGLKAPSQPMARLTFRELKIHTSEVQTPSTGGAAFPSLCSSRCEEGGEEFHIF